MGFLDLPGLQYFYNKYIKGLKSHAFRDPANNLTTTASGYALDARQGKALDDKVTQLNSALALMNTSDTTDGSSFSKNFLNIGISNANDDRNKRTYFVISQDDQEGFTNVPPGLFKSGNSSAGVREVYRISQNLAMIKITEIHPVPGTQYFRTYNNGSWNTPGWKIITPE